MNTPEVPATLQPPRTPRNCWTWIIRSCPYCSQTHTHGAGRNGTVAGSRVAHCATGSSPKPSYRITPTTT